MNESKIHVLIERLGWMLLWLSFLVACAVPLFATGCALFKTPEITKPDGTTETVKPDSFEDSVVVSYNGIAGMRLFALDLAKRHVITPDKLKAVSAQLDELHDRVDVARGYWKGGSNVTAAQLLDTVTAVLLSIEIELSTQETTNGKRTDGKDSGRSHQRNAGDGSRARGVAALPGDYLQGSRGGT